MGRTSQCLTSATSGRNRSIDSRVVKPEGLGRYIGSKETAMQTTRLERMALARIFVAGWVAFSAPIAHAQPLYASPHRHSHRRPSIHRLHTLCLNRPRPPFHQDRQAPFRDHLRGSRLRVEVHPARSLARIGGRLPQRRRPTSRKSTKAGIALGVTLGTGAKVKPPFLRPRGECAVHSNPRTDVMPSGALVRIDAGAS
jgi:hypothetical protein